MTGVAPDDLRHEAMMACELGLTTIPELRSVFRSHGVPLDWYAAACHERSPDVLKWIQDLQVRTSDAWKSVRFLRGIIA